MRRVVLALAAFAAVGLAGSTALAQDEYRFYYGPVYENQIRVNYGAYPAASYYRGAPKVPYYRGAPAEVYYPGAISHAAAVRQIMAEHSRNRYYTHPMSLYNSAPVAPIYYGRGYGY